MKRIKALILTTTLAITLGLGVSVATNFDSHETAHAVNGLRGPHN